MIIGSKFYHESKCHNSIDWAEQEIIDAPDGSIFIADKHEITRGRQSRVWQQYDGQLIMTVLLKPENIQDIESDKLDLYLNRLSMAIALGVLDPLLGYGVSLKWPNDFVLKNKKIGGILGKTVLLGDKVQGVIFGFALNVNNVFCKKDELYKIATSLKQVFNDDINKNLLFHKIVEGLDIYYKRWIDQKYSYIYKFWKQHQFYLNKKITVHKKDGSLVEGLFDDVLENGDLILQVNDQKETLPFCLVDLIS